MPKSQQKVSKENNKMPKGDRSPKVGQIKWRLFAVWELFRCLTIEVFALPESHSGEAKLNLTSKLAASEGEGLRINWS